LNSPDCSVEVVEATVMNFCANIAGDAALSANVSNAISINFRFLNSTAVLL
jgi:hypothetical protein